MAIQIKRSDTPGSVPNLVWGERAINAADGILWARHEGARIKVDVEAVRDRSAPLAGQEGAPLAFRDGVQVWDPTLAPAGVVDGAIRVDLPPTTGWGVPGAQITGLGVDRSIGINSVQIEPFEVRSDQITLTAMAFSLRSVPGGQMRFGVYKADDSVLIDRLVPSPAVGVNSVTLNIILPRGKYKAAVWAEAGATFVQTQAVQPEQGWRLNGSDMNFVRSYETTQDMSIEFATPSASVERLSATPGVDKLVLMHWTVP